MIFNITLASSGGKPPIHGKWQIAASLLACQINLLHFLIQYSIGMDKKR